MSTLLDPILLTQEEIKTAEFLERNTGMDDQCRDKNQCLKLLKALEDAHIIGKNDLYLSKLTEELEA